MNERSIRDAKINQLKHGESAYAESSEMIRLVKRGIAKQQLHVHCDNTSSGCWFIPIKEESACQS